MGPLRRWSMRFSPRRESRVWMAESEELFSACSLHPPASTLLRRKAHLPSVSFRHLRRAGGGDWFRLTGEKAEIRNDPFKGMELG